MFGLGEDDEEEQRLWNFLIFKMPLTDKEMEEGSWLEVFIVLVIIGLLLYFVK